jgi:hypothetical protein
LVILLLSLSAGCAGPAGNPVDVPVHNPGPGYRLVGRLGVPMGQMVTIQGVVVESGATGYGGSTRLWVRRIDGRATQAALLIPIHPFGLDEWGSEFLPFLEPGASYELDGYETGGFVGVPNDVGRDVYFQTSGFGFTSGFVAARGRGIETRPDAPEDHPYRSAHLEGTARNHQGRPALESPGWTVRLSGDPWPTDEVDRQAWAYGVVRGGPGAYTLEEVSRRGVTSLDDMIGREVELRGVSWSMNGHPTFAYRGESVPVELAEKTWWGHGDATLVRGRLERIDPPRFNEEFRRAERYILRAARGEPAPDLLTPEHDLPGR